MPERITGIKGYVGELVVQEWLKKVKHKSGDCRVMSQVIPANVNRKGGPHLDLCVTKKDEIIEIYEVKAQNYPIGSINKSLSYLWGLEKGLNRKYFDRKLKEEAYIADPKKTFYLSPNLKSYLVLMRKPSTEFLEEFAEYKRHILYLKNIIRDIHKHIDKESLIQYLKKQFAQDVAEVIGEMIDPDNG